MSGETDLSAMLVDFDVVARPDAYVYALLDSSSPLRALSLATVVEDEGLTAVLKQDDADAHGITYDFVASWITLTVHSSLHAVGLTALFSKALSDHNISCNVLAGLHHDHVLVGIGDRDRAISVLRSLRTGGD